MQTSSKPSPKSCRPKPKTVCLAYLRKAGMPRYKSVCTDLRYTLLRAIYLQCDMPCGALVDLYHIATDRKGGYIAFACKIYRVCQGKHIAKNPKDREFSFSVLLVVLFDKFVDGAAQIVNGFFVAGGNGVHHTVAHMVLQNDLAGIFQC